MYRCHLIAMSHNVVVFTMIGNECDTEDNALIDLRKKIKRKLRQDKELPPEKRPKDALILINEELKAVDVQLFVEHCETGAVGFRALDSSSGTITKVLIKAKAIINEYFRYQKEKSSWEKSLV